MRFSHTSKQIPWSCGIFHAFFFAVFDKNKEFLLCALVLASLFLRFRSEELASA